MTLPAQLRRGRAPGDILDGRGRLFASIHAGQGEAPGSPGLAALAEAVIEIWNTRASLHRECDRLEKALKLERGERILAEAQREELRVALDAQRILRSITETGS